MSISALIDADLSIAKKTCQKNYSINFNDLLVFLFRSFWFLHQNDLPMRLFGASACLCTNMKHKRAPFSNELSKLSIHFCYFAGDLAVYLAADAFLESYELGC